MCPHLFCQPICMCTRCGYFPSSLCQFHLPTPFTTVPSGILKWLATCGHTSLASGSQPWEWHCTQASLFLFQTGKCIFALRSVAFHFNFLIWPARIWREFSGPVSRLCIHLTIAAEDAHRSGQVSFTLFHPRRSNDVFFLETEFTKICLTEIWTSLVSWSHHYLLEWGWCSLLDIPTDQGSMYLPPDIFPPWNVPPNGLIFFKV